MQETRLAFDSHGQTLVGTLLSPSGPGPFPAALLVPGSGPVDRDSDHRRMALGVTRELAQALTAAGFVTLRYDKRGVGESSGEWLAAGLTDNVDDAAAALEALADQPGVDAERLVVVGHSEGALIAAALASRGAVPGGVALLSASATPGEELLLWQARRIAPSLPAPVRWLLAVTRTDLEKKVAKNHQRIKSSAGDVERIGLQKVNARWMREFMAHDPRDDLARITVPVLAVTGAKDLQVSPRDLDAIARLAQAPVETHEVPDVSHILRTQPGTATLRTYGKDATRPVDARVLSLVTGWATRVVAAGGVRRHQPDGSGRPSS